MKFLKDIDLKGARVLYRVDINSNIKDGKLLDDDRIRAIIPTVREMQKMGARQIIIMAHQGRENKRGPDTVLDLHANRLSELLGQKVLKFDQCRGVEIPKDAELVMLENVRLDDEASEDAAKRQACAVDLSKYGDVYVNDAFAACHREHSTICELPKLMKVKAAGLLLQKEKEALKPLLKGEIEQPFTLIVGGAKIDTKIALINNFAKKAGAFLLGGGIANTFLAAEGFDIGMSLQEKDKYETAREIALSLDKRLFLPKDVICADKCSASASTVDVPVEDVIGDMMILDIGKKTAQNYAEIIKQSKTIIWNGPMGYAEYPQFRKGSEAIARAMAEADATTIIGGGESVGVINMLGIPHDKYTHVSTGGGAMLEYLSGVKLPGIEALK